MRIALFQFHGIHLMEAIVNITIPFMLSLINGNAKLIKFRVFKISPTHCETFFIEETKDVDQILSNCN